MTGAPDFGIAAERQLRRACEELDRSLRGGRSDRAEHYFALHPLFAAQAHSAVELIYAEFTAREELGHRPTPEEYYLRFPRWKDALRRQFGIHEWMRNHLTNEAPDGSQAPPDGANGPARGVPRWLGTYELIEEIGRGAGGGVYEAWQHGLERAVAVKLLPPGAARPEARARFLREARVMARLRHPNIMPIYEVAEYRGVVYFSMQLARGGPLSGRSADALAAPATVLRWMEAVAHAVHHAHENGVVHCDLKPSNILLDDDRPLVSDFGLAQEPGGEAAGSHALIGSPAYMAPEQITARPGAHAPAADIWALGVLLYELLTGERPFLSDNLADLRRRICDDEPEPLGERAPWLPPQLESIGARCLAKDPARRYPSARALAHDLAACRPGALPD